MATHFDHDPAEKNSIKNAAKTEESQMEIVDKIWTNVVKEWLPQSEVMFLRYSGFALPFLSIIPAYEVGKLGIQWGPSRACVKLVRPLFHVIYMNART